MGAPARYTKTLSFALAPPMYDRVVEVAAEREVSIGTVLRETLRVGLANQHKPAEFSGAPGGDD